MSSICHLFTHFSLHWWRQGNNPMGMVPLKKAIAQTANAYVHSVELCSEPSKLENCDGEVSPASGKCA